MEIIRVALLAEGVDRNSGICHPGVIANRSPSSRRAWIEIFLCSEFGEAPLVALLAEGVDRNKLLCDDGPAAK